MIAKFNKGDRVTSLVGHMPGMEGATGEITIVRTEPAYYGVTMDGDDDVHKWLAEDEIEATTAAKPTKKKPMKMGNSLSTGARSSAIERATQVCSRATVGTTVLAMRSAGVDVSAAKREELLSACAAGGYVELEVDVVAFEQAPGSLNRKHVRFRDGAMMKLGTSGRGNPVLRDHEQNDVNARAGTVIASKTEKRADGDYVIRQTFRLTAPWAVALALRGLLDTVSIGWHPTGPVNCSACDAPIFSSCYHLPGDRLKFDGNRKVSDDAGELVVEWIFTDAELVETSLVSVPAVPSAQIEGIRAALAAEPLFQPQESVSMRTIFPALAAILSLAPTAGEDEVMPAVEALKKDRDTFAAKLAISESERTKLAAIVEEHRGVQRKADEDTFVRDALSSGRIAPADDGMWRKLFSLDASGAREEMAKRAVGCATPVGAPRQAGGQEPAVVVDPTKLGKSVSDTLAANGVNPELALGFAKLFGAKTPEKTIGQALGLKQEG